MKSLSGLLDGVTGYEASYAEQILATIAVMDWLLFPEYAGWRGLKHKRID